MLNRNVSLAVCLSLLASISAFGQGNQGTGYVFELPGANSAGSSLQGFIYNGNFLGPDIPTVSGPVGASQIIAKPDGSKFYVVGANAGGLESVDPTFTNFSAISGISGIVCSAVITPDGRRLLVGAGPTCGPAANSSTLYVLDTSTNTILPNSLGQIPGSILGFAVSPDSSTAWMLNGSPSVQSVTQFSVSTLQLTATVNLPYGGLNGITLAPSGLLYVTGANTIYEITPTAANILGCNPSFPNEVPPLCLTPSGYIQVLAKPGPLQFTPSGQVAYMIDTDPTYGRSILQLNVATHAVSFWPPPNSGPAAPSFSSLLVAGENTIYALSATDPNYPTTLWDVASSPLSAAIDTTFSSLFPPNDVLSVAISSEVPSAVYLYALIENGNQTDLYRVNLATGKPTESVANLGAGQLQFFVVPPETGAAGFYSVQPANATETVTAGAAVTLTALVLDGTGRPVYNQAVSFAEAATDPVMGVVIAGATKTTNANGYATATATVPTTPGTYTVVLTAGTATLNFALTVPGANSGGGGGSGSGASSQVSIVSGNGEFIQANYPVFGEPLTIQVVSTKGVPLSGVPVTFSVGVGQITGAAIGQISNTNAITDSNGLASTTFTSPSLPLGQTLNFDSTTVLASTSVGSVTFVETVFNVNPNGTGSPSIILVTPISQTITVGEGDVLPNGIVYNVSASQTGNAQYVPNIGIRLASLNDITTPGIASCQGSSLSDQNGNARCNVQIACIDPATNSPVTPGSSYGFSAVVGELRSWYGDTGFRLNVTTGSSQTFNIKNGNNQSGSAGATLPIQLVAGITDNCGAPKPGVPVTWTVTQGSATLSGTLSTSDSAGNVHTSVVLGQSPGSVLVTVSSGSAQAVFTLTNNVVVSGISLTKGQGQSAYTNTAFALPLVFVVTDVNQNPLSGIVVNFSATSGNASVSPLTATTNAQGTVTTNVTAGSTTGTVTVVATTGAVSATATLTVTLPPLNITPSSFTSAASVNTSSPQVGLVPCGLNSVTGVGLAATVQGVLLGNALGFGPLPYSLGGVTMYINGVAVPLYSVSNSNGVQQINFQTPCETAPGLATAVIQVNGATTVVSAIQVLPTQPGILNYAGPNNTPYGFVISASDGSYVTPNNPAHRGGTYYLVLTGLGQTTPQITTNAAGTGNEVIPVANVVVGVNNAGVPVNFAEYAPDQIGVYVISFTIPANAPTGTNQPLGVQVNGVFGNASYLPGVI